MLLAFLVTVVVGYLGSATLGVAMNWPDAGAIFAVAAMGCFILRAVRRSKSGSDPQQDSTPDHE